MTTAMWSADPQGRYWLDVLLGGQTISVMVDSGLVDPDQRVGFELDRTLFDQLKESGKLSGWALRVRKDASGRSSALECASTDGSLAVPGTTDPFGRTIQIHVARGAAQIPSRVGVVFFHRLPGCRVLWNCELRTWSVSFS